MLKQILTILSLLVTAGFFLMACDLTENKVEEETSLAEWSADDPHRITADNADRIQLLSDISVTHKVASLAFSPVGKLLAVGTFYGDVWLWDAWDAHPQSPLAAYGEDTHVLSVVFSPKGTLLAAGLSDGTVRLWDVKGWSNLDRIDAHPAGVASLAFSPDGRLLASGSGDGTVRIWQVEDREFIHIRTLEGHNREVCCIAFSPDGTLLASGSLYDTVHLWQVEDGQSLDTHETPKDWVYSLTFSPDSSLLAVGYDDGTVRLLDVEDRLTIIDRLDTFTDGVNSVIFSSDGTLLVAGLADDTVQLYRVEDWEYLRRLDGQNGPYDQVNSLAFSPDGTLLVSGSADGTVRLWHVEASTGSEAEVTYNFADHTCEAEWYSNQVGREVTALPCNGSETDDRGLVRPGTVHLEDSQTYHKAIEIHPKATDDGGGGVDGRFELSTPLQPGDRFVTELGFLEDATEGDVAFYITCSFYHEERANVMVGSKSYDNSLKPISTLFPSDCNGATYVTLKLMSNDSDTDDYAAWVNPRIESS